MKPSKNFLMALTASVLLLWCVSASAQDVKYNFMPGTNFAKYKTYKWVRIPNVEYPNQILDNQIMRSIDAQLASKGLTRVEDDSADLFVCYQAAVNQEKQWNSYSNDMGGWGYGRWGGWGGYGGGMSTTTTTTSTINIGTLNVDIYDVAAKNQIWRGAASKTLGSGKDPNKVNKNIDKATAKLFKKYPPPQK
jgi:hypothetical protein